ncbi:hypothetical protein ACSQ67_016234 [Phaseolus vulgaris]
MTWKVVTYIPWKMNFDMLCYDGETMQAANAKKPCTTTSKATKPKSSPLKDPQNVAAKFAGPLAFENEEYNGSLPNLKLKRQRLSMHTCLDPYLLPN